MISSQKSTVNNTQTTTFQLPSNVNLAIEVTTTGPEELRNNYYKLKCSRIQKQIKELIFINSALQDECTHNKEKLSSSRSERKLLYTKLVAHQKQNQANSKAQQQALSANEKKLSQSNKKT